MVSRRAFLCQTGALAGAAVLGIDLAEAEITCAKIRIYDDIGFQGITAQQFGEQLNAAAGRPVVILMNSFGGEVWEAIAMYNALKLYPERKFARINGVAFGAASIVAMAADDISIEKDALIGIADPWGTFQEWRKGAEPPMSLSHHADLLAQVKTAMLPCYSRTRKTHDELCEMMREETWMRAEEAVAAGFADSIHDSSII